MKLKQPLAIEKEIEKEKAAALGRTGAKLRGYLLRLNEIRKMWAEEKEALRGLEARVLRRHPAPRWALLEREGCLCRLRALSQAYQRTLQKATTYRYYLIVQREAIGFRSHWDVDRLYPLPLKDASDISPPPPNLPF